jgi:alpha-methylacyl-CoA racemase
MGPLHGVTVLEIASIGPGPFCGMMLADLGAAVVRIDRADAVGPAPTGSSLELMNRGKRSIGVDLKNPSGVQIVLRMVEQADGLIEGFRPGVAERLGIGPDACRARNPRLVYGRMTGWGQKGPLSGSAGHDINYLALSGALHPIGRSGEPPVVPLNLVGDFGGGGMLLALGIAAGLFEARGSGQGQVIDAAMIDGSALLTTMFHGMRAMGLWSDRRGVNLLDTGAPFYEVYETSDGGFVAVGAIEPQFYAEFIDLLELEGELPDQLDAQHWPEMKRRIAARFKSRSRRDWEATFAGSDACVAPVLTMGEAPDHPHHRARGTFLEVDGVTQPAPGPRFDRTPGAISGPPPVPGRNTDEILAEFGVGAAEQTSLRESGAIR